MMVDNVYELRVFYLLPAYHLFGPEYTLMLQGCPCLRRKALGISCCEPEMGYASILDALGSDSRWQLVGRLDDWPQQPK